MFSKVNITALMIAMLINLGYVSSESADESSENSSSLSSSSSASSSENEEHVGKNYASESLEESTPSSIYTPDDLAKIKKDSEKYQQIIDAVLKHCSLITISNEQFFKKKIPITWKRRALDEVIQFLENISSKKQPISSEQVYEEIIDILQSINRLKRIRVLPRFAKGLIGAVELFLKKLP